MVERNYRKLKFDEGVPVRVKLRYDEPRKKTGDYGPYYSYALIGGSESDYPYFYAAEPLHRRIQDEGKRRGDVFTITKQKRMNPDTRKDEVIWVISGEAGSQGNGAQIDRTGGASRQNASGYDVTQISIKYQTMLKCASWVVASSNVQGYHSRFHTESGNVDMKKVAEEISELAYYLYKRHEHSVNHIVNREEEKEPKRVVGEEKKVEPEQNNENFIATGEGGGEDPFALLDDSMPF